MTISIKTLTPLAVLLALAASPATADPAPGTAADAATAWQETAPPVGSAVIYRDPWGVPHIQARREEDGFYALGYALAADDLEDELRQHAIGKGRMAQYFGADYVGADTFYAQFHVAEAAHEGYQRLPAQLRKDLDAYVDGFNRYLADHPNERPDWAKGLTPQAQDLIGFDQLFTLMFPVNLAAGIGDCRRGGVNVPNSYMGLVRLLHTSGPSDASTGWAVAPWRTADHVAIHLADPHSSLDVPSPEFRIHAGDFEFAGYTTGMMMVGHSRHASWGTTFGSPDVADCYAFKTEAGDPTAYRRDGALHHFLQSKVRIPVKDGPDRDVTLEFAEVNGEKAPVVTRENGVAYAVATPYMTGAEGSIVDLYNMAKAKDLDGIKAALADQGLFPVGLTVADSSGNIGYFRIGRTPRRDDSIDWTRPVSGNTSASDWKGGLHPASDLVQVLNPKQGYVRETNLGPESMWGGDNPFHAPAYPRYIIGDVPELNHASSPMSRGQRVDEVLSASFDLTSAEAEGFVFNERWPNVAQWQEALKLALAAAPTPSDAFDADGKRVLQRILTFDGVASASSQPALAYAYWKDGVLQAVAKAKIDPAGLADHIVHRQALSAAEQAALVDGARAAAGTFNTLKQWDAVYGDVFRIGRGGESFPIGGCSTPFESSLHTFDCQPPGTAVRKALAGEKQVMLTIFSTPLKSYSLEAFGQPWRAGYNGPHLNDQARMTSEHKLKPVLFDYEDLIQHVESKMTLVRSGGK